MRRLVLIRDVLVAATTVSSLILGTQAGKSQADINAVVQITGSAEPWTAGAQLVGPHSAGAPLTVALVLNTSQPNAQTALVRSLYQKSSPSYHHWLATGQFESEFAPAASDVAAATSFLTGAGLQIEPSGDSTTLLATGSVGQVEAAFHTTINDYRLADGSIAYGNPTAVEIPATLSPAVLGVFGLSNLAVAKPDLAVDTNASTAVAPYGAGPGGSGLTPSQIHSIYDAGPVYHSLNDSGQGVSLAVYELATYTPSDITHYEARYGLNQVPLINKLVLGGATTHNGAGEVELDIELQIAMAQGAKDIQVYQAPNTELGGLLQYRQIATDNTADVISSSWGFPCEFALNSQVYLAENQIFLQMAAQGQSLFASSGDAGAFGCTAAGIALSLPQALQVADPGNQPYVTSVGGTSFRKPDKGAVLFDPGTNLNTGYPTNGAEGT